MITNLPIALTSFIGRQVRWQRSRDLLAHHRLLTLTGPGGCGKTRLAIQVAGDVVDRYRHGVWFTDLAGVQDAALVERAVAHTLGVQTFESQTAGEVLIAFLHTRQALLVLDNCEHLVAGCARLARDVLSACAGVSVLSTSREVFGLAGEAVFVVPPLSLPPPGAVVRLADLEAYEATRLFVERATTAAPGLLFTEPSAPVVAAMCGRLDGMPLAIELAAARLRALSITQLASHLDERFALLTIGAGGALPRQHSLQATIDWSYGLLSASEQRLLRCLSVFASSFNLLSAQAVYADEASEAEVLDLLCRLVDKSLVTPEQSGEERRYRLLETIKLYAWQRAAELGETAEIVHRFIGLYDGVSRSGYENSRGEALSPWQLDHDNIRRALAWCWETGDSGAAALIIIGSWTIWSKRGEQRDFGAWVERLATVGPPSDALTQVAALIAAQNIARNRPDWLLARSLADRSVAVARASGDTRLLSWALHFQGATMLFQGDYEAAIAALQESDAIRPSFFSVPIHPYTLAWQADALMRLGALAQSRQMWEASLPIAEQLRNAGAISHTLRGLGRLSLHEGDLATGGQRVRAALQAAVDYRHLGEYPDDIDACAQAAQAAGADRRAATLWGAADRVRAVVRRERFPFDVPMYQTHLSALRSQMGDAAFEEAHARGYAMTLEQAVAFALEEDTAAPAVCQ